ncbi:hypothetical protein D3C86_1857660 [compost metagenome]
MHFVSRDRRRQLFHHFQRNHLPGNFGKAFSSPFDLYKALLIKTHDIAGVIPASFHFALRILRRRCFEHTWVFHPQIAVHHVRPFEL